MSPHQRLPGYPVVIEVPLAWGEMDAFRHLNNVVYFRYFESARIAYFAETRVLEHLEASGIGPILASTRCRFRVPLTHPDRVLVGARVSRLGGDRFTHEYAVFSLERDLLAAEGEGEIVFFDYQAEEKAAIPEGVREAILALQGDEPAPYPPRN